MTMTPINSLSFEAAFDELETIVAQLESGDLPLEDSVAHFERGRELAAHCQALLDQADLRVSQLNADGNISAL